jgi:Ran GTPase-activating protein (RanGAP) involved in mRNA processing and transport
VEAAPELALLEIPDRVFAEGDVFGEEVVEVVRDEGVVDAAGVAEGAEDEEAEEEVAEAAARFLR